MIKTNRYTVVENAGYEGERDVRTFERFLDADRWIRSRYGDDEVESLHVLIRRDNGKQRTYEF